MFETLIGVALLSGVAAASAAFYLVPVLIGWVRHVPDLGALAVIDVLLGWTLVGWVVALAMALRSVGPAGPVVQLVQNLPPSSLPQGQAPAWWAGPAGPPPLRAGSPPPLVLPRRSSRTDDRAQAG